MYQFPSIKITKKTKIWVDPEPPSPEVLNKYIDAEGKIFFGEKFIGPVNFLNTNVKYIIFTEGDDIIYPLDNLPNSVKGIIFDTESVYTSNLDNLPNSLIMLKFKVGSNFNSPINNLPSSLKKLTIKSYDFNQSVDMLPEFLEELSLGYYYAQPINSLPANLKILVILSNKQKFIINKLPENLLFLSVDITSITNDINFLPNGLKYLHMVCKSLFQVSKIKFPELTKLKIQDQNGGKKKSTKIPDGKKLIINNLPNSLLEFKINTSNQNYLIEKIPDSLNKLILLEKKFNIENYNLTGKKFFIVNENDDNMYDSDDSDDYYKDNDKCKHYEIHIFN